MALHKLTVEALEHKAGVAWEEAGADHNDPADQRDWECTARDCEAAVAEGTLAGHDLAAREVGDYLSYGSAPRKEWLALQTDLARGGHLERDNPLAVYLGRRPRTVTVDGVKFTAW